MPDCTSWIPAFTRTSDRVTVISAWTCFHQCLRLAPTFVRIHDRVRCGLWILQNNMGWRGQSGRTSRQSNGARSLAHVLNRCPPKDLDCSLAHVQTTQRLGETIQCAELGCLLPADARRPQFSAPNVRRSTRLPEKRDPPDEACLPTKLDCVLPGRSGVSHGSDDNFSGFVRPLD